MSVAPAQAGLFSDEHASIDELLAQSSRAATVEDLPPAARDVPGIRQAIQAGKSFPRRKEKKATLDEVRQADILQRARDMGALPQPSTPLSQVPERQRIAADILAARTAAGDLDGLAPDALDQVTTQVFKRAEELDVDELKQIVAIDNARLAAIESDRRLGYLEEVMRSIRNPTRPLVKAAQDIGRKELAQSGLPEKLAESPRLEQFVRRAADLPTAGLSEVAFQEAGAPELEGFLSMASEGKIPDIAAALAGEVVGLTTGAGAAVFKGARKAATKAFLSKGTQRAIQQKLGKGAARKLAGPTMGAAEFGAFAASRVPSEIAEAEHNLGRELSEGERAAMAVHSVGAAAAVGGVGGALVAPARKYILEPIGAKIVDLAQRAGRASPELLTEFERRLAYANIRPMMRAISEDVSPSAERMAAANKLIDITRKNLLRDLAKLETETDPAVRTILKRGVDAHTQNLKQLGLDVEVEMLDEGSNVIIRESQRRLAQKAVVEAAGGDLERATPELSADLTPLSQKVSDMMDGLLQVFGRQDERFARMARNAGLTEKMGFDTYIRGIQTLKSIEMARKQIEREKIELGTIQIDVPVVSGGMGAPPVVGRKFTLMPRELQDELKTVMEYVPNDAVDAAGNITRLGSKQRAGVLFPSNVPAEVAEQRLPLVLNPEKGVVVRALGREAEEGNIGRITKVFDDGTVNVQFGRNGRPIKGVQRIPVSDLRLSPPTNEANPLIGAVLDDGRIVGTPFVNKATGKAEAFQLYRELGAEEGQARLDALVAKVPEAVRMIATLRSQSERLLLDEAKRLGMPPKSLTLLQEFARVEGLQDIEQPLRAYVPDIRKRGGGPRRAISVLARKQAPGSRFKTGSTREEERANQAFFEAIHEEALRTGQSVKKLAKQTNYEPFGVPFLDAWAQRRAEFFREYLEHDLIGDTLQMWARPLERGARVPKGWKRLDQLLIQRPGATQAEALDAFVKLVEKRPEVFEEFNLDMDALRGTAQELRFRGPQQWIVPERLDKEMAALLGQTGTLLGRDAGILMALDRATGRALSIASSTSMLSRPVTAERNAVTGGIQTTAMLVEDFWRGVFKRIWSTGLEKEAAFDHLVGDVFALVPWHTNGAGGKYSFRDIDGALMGRTLAQEIVGIAGQAAGPQRVERAAMAMNNAVETFYKRYIAAATRTAAVRRKARELLAKGELTEQELPAFYQRMAETMDRDVYGQITDRTGTFAFNYNNQTRVGQFFQTGGASELGFQVPFVAPLGKAVMPFPKWIYNMVRLYNRQLGPKNLWKAVSGLPSLGKKASPEAREQAIEHLARAMAGMTMTGFGIKLTADSMNFLQEKLKDANSPLGESSHDPTDRYRVGVTGMLQAATKQTPDKTWELWMRAGDMPYVSEGMAFWAMLGDGGPSASDYIRDRVSFGPFFQSFLAATQGLKTDDGKYKSNISVAAEGLKPLIPFQPWLELIANMEDPIERRTYDEHMSSLEQFLAPFAENVPVARRKLLDPRVIVDGQRRGSAVPIDQWQELMKFFVWNAKVVDAGERSEAEKQAMLRTQPAALENDPDLRAHFTNDQLRSMIGKRMKGRKLSSGLIVKDVPRTGEEENYLILRSILARREYGEGSEEYTAIKDSLDRMRALRRQEAESRAVDQP